MTDSPWAGRIASGLATMFFVMDGVMKLFKPACTLLYIIPRTSILGAVLLTGYLGGAVASNVRAETALFNTLFPVAVAIVIWAGLWLRDGRARQLVAL